MSRILVAGLANVETTIKVDGFPIQYTPVHYVFNQIQSRASGVGFNVACALTTLGHDVEFRSIIGDDAAGEIVRHALRSRSIDDARILSLLPETPQSVVFYNAHGKRMIHVDLKAVQEATLSATDLKLDKIDLAVLTNANFCRALLRSMQNAGVPIATDVHTISDIDDAYNRDFMEQATILFMSHERLPVNPERWIHTLWEQYETPIVGIGMGAGGALLGVRADNHIERIPARAMRPIVSTIGSGDALFSAFIHGYLVEQDPYIAMKKAVLFAGYKIGSSGGSEGHLTRSQLDKLYDEHREKGE